MGHAAQHIIRHIIRRFALPSVSNTVSSVCNARQQGKSHRLPFSSSSHVTQNPIELIFSDVWVSTRTSISGHSYYASFVDAHSRFTWIYLLQLKRDVYDIFLKYQNYVERLLNHKILRIQADWRGEYIKLHKIFEKLGILQWVSCPHTHQKNEKIKGKHRHIVETGLLSLLMPPYLFNIGVMLFWWCVS